MEEDYSKENVQDKTVLPNNSKRNRILYVISILTVILFITNAVTLYLYTNLKNEYLQKTVKTDTEKTAVSTQTEKQEDTVQLPRVFNYQTIGSKYFATYKNENKYPYKIDLPSNYLPDLTWTVSVESTDEIINDYEEYRQTGCPGACSTLIENDNLQKQFDILTKVSQSTDCKINDDLKSEIDNFILFAKGIENPQLVDVIYNSKLKTCGLKFVGYDGYDVGLSNFEYEAGFIIDGKIIRISFELFPLGRFKEVDDLWKSLGYGSDGNMANMESNVGKLIDNLDFNDDIVRGMIAKFDKSVSSFDFL